MIDFSNEHLITPAEVAKRIPSGISGKRIHIATVHRWFHAGHLECVKIGGRKFTSLEAVQRFISKCNRRIKDRDSSAPVNPSKGTAASWKAMQQLEQLGI